MKYLLSMLAISNFTCLVCSKVVINKYDECQLDPNLVKEIQSYKNIASRIYDHVTKADVGDRMYEQYTHFIDKFGARPSGTITLENAIDYMINLTKKNGLHDVVTEDVEAPHWVRGEESLKMIKPYNKKLALLGLGSSVSTPSDGITAEVIVVDSFQALEKLDDAQVRGKIVLFDAHYVTYGDTVIYRSQGATKASRKGAIASLVRSITPFSIYTPHTGHQHYGNNVTKIPTAAITLEDADLLRRLQTEGEKIIVSLKMQSSFDVKKSRNTIIDLKGKQSPQKSVIVSGHIDSWDVGQGAMDDGGGMMISWFVPVVLNQMNLKPKRTIRAILWTSEESGLVGAETFLKRHKAELADINFIMESDEGTFKPLGLEVAGSSTARCIVAEVLKLFTPIDKMTESDDPGSDISLIVAEGVPGASLLNENEKYFWFHHSEADTMDVQNKTNVVSCAGFWAAFSYVLADLSIDIPRN